MTENAMQSVLAKNDLKKAKYANKEGLTVPKAANKTVRKKLTTELSMLDGLTTQEENQVEQAKLGYGMGDDARAARQ